VPLDDLGSVRHVAEELVDVCTALTVFLPIFGERQVPVVVVQFHRELPVPFGTGQVLPRLGLIAGGHLRGVPAGREEVVGLAVQLSNCPLFRPGRDAHRCRRSLLAERGHLECIGLDRIGAGTVGAGFLQDALKNGFRRGAVQVDLDDELVGERLGDSEATSLVIDV
jgi:hypothetical protein